ncbi:MAG TPA: hypothetical protein VEB43_10725 [Anaeromyxobacter sp.]|nr:hypothetical protein [Anaeromyxobacter sp.]
MLRLFVRPSVLAALALLATAPARAHADDQVDSGPAFSLLLSAGPFSSFGGGVSFGTPRFGLRATAGWVPIILGTTTTDEEGDEEVDLDIYNSLQVAPDLYVMVSPPKSWGGIGLQGGYRYNSVLGSGIGAGGFGQFRVRSSMDLLVNAGFMVFPNGEEGLRDKADLAEDVEFGFPGPEFQISASVALAFRF